MNMKKTAIAGVKITHVPDISVQLTPQYVGLHPLSKNDFLSEY